MKYQNRRLNVLSNGLLMGYLEKTENGMLKFLYTDEWLQTAGARPLSLSMPLTKKSYEGETVYSFFDNLLPDNTNIRARIQRKFQITSGQPFDILAVIGKDCVGAIQITEGDMHDFEKSIQAEPLNNKKLASILANYQENPLGMTDDNKEFRVSIAGAQEKFAFLYHNNQWCQPLGTTPTTHIFKLPIGYIQHQQLDLSDSCENEWICAQIARAFELPIANCEIQTFENTKALIVERFDRKLSQDKTWLIRLPQEDMCQALNTLSDLKYQSDGGPGIKQIMNLLLGSSQSNEDREIFFRSQILFWLLGAIDGHAKNFSIFLEAGGKYRLTPLYDIISAYPLIANSQLPTRKVKMAMALKSQSNHYHWYSIQRQHFISAAKDANYSGELAESLLDDMLSKIDPVITQVQAQLPANFPEHISQPIFNGMRSIKNRLKK